jgi:hypothetical protein
MPGPAALRPGHNFPSRIADAMRDSSFTCTLGESQARTPVGTGNQLRNYEFEETRTSWSSNGILGQLQFQAAPPSLRFALQNLLFLTKTARALGTRAIVK